MDDSFTLNINRLGPKAKVCMDESFTLNLRDQEKALPNDFSNHLTMDIGQAKVSPGKAERKAFVIHPQLV